MLRINAGGRTFHTLHSTLAKFPHSPLAALAAVAADSNARAPVVEKAPSKSTGQSKRGKKVEKVAASPTMGHNATDSSYSLQPLDRRQVGCEALLHTGCGSNKKPAEDFDVFIDVKPEVFDAILQFLRTGNVSLPVEDESLRADVISQFERWELLQEAFPPVTRSSGSAGQQLRTRSATNDDATNAGEEEGETDEGEEGDDAAEPVQLPDVLVVQLNDHMQYEQGVKRHAVTITYGADGFQLKHLCKTVRQDLNTLLSATYWQMYQTNERSAFFVSTKMSNASADLLLTSLSQNVIQHTESAFGYQLVSSYVTLSPDTVHVSVRVLVHYLIFRRVRSPKALEMRDENALMLSDEGNADDDGDAGDGDDDDDEDGDGDVREQERYDKKQKYHKGVYSNYEAPHVGPEMPSSREGSSRGGGGNSSDDAFFNQTRGAAPSRVPPSHRVNLDKL